MWQGAEGGLQPTANNKLRPSGLQPQQPNAAKNHMNLETFFPSQTSNDTTALANALITALWDPEAEDPAKPCQTPDPEKWYHNNCELF